jgi:hypothetical protein
VRRGAWALAPDVAVSTTQAHSKAATAALGSRPQIRWIILSSYLGWTGVPHSGRCLASRRSGRVCRSAAPPFERPQIACRWCPLLPCEAARPAEGGGSRSHGSPSLHVSPPASRRVPRSAALLRGHRDLGPDLPGSSLIRLSSNLKWRKLKPCDKDRQAIATRSPNRSGPTVGTLEGSHRFAIGDLGDEGCRDRCKKSGSMPSKWPPLAAVSLESPEREEKACRWRSQVSRRTPRWLATLPPSSRLSILQPQCSQGLHRGARKT